MKTTRTWILLTFGSYMAYGQAPAHKVPFPAERPVSAEDYRVQAIKRLMSMTSPLQIGRIDLNRMGDEASTDVLKVLGTNPSLTPEQQQTVLDIVHMSFEQPAAISNPADKKPQAATFLLQYLRGAAQDDAVKERVASELAFIQKAAPSPSPATKP